MKLSLTKLMKYRDVEKVLRDTQMPAYEAWLTSCGWRRSEEVSKTGGHMWWRPDEDPKKRQPDWSVSEALRQCAEVEGAKRIVANGGMAAPLEYGVAALGELCRLPGTWHQPEGQAPQSLRGSGGKWLRLGPCLRAMGLDEVSVP